MTQGGISRVVARLLRPFHRKDRHEDRHETQDAARTGDRGAKQRQEPTTATRKLAMAAASGDVELPAQFFRLLRAVEQQTPATVEMLEGTVTGPALRHSTFSASSGSLLAKRTEPVTAKTLERIAALLREDEGDADGAALGNSRLSFADGRPTLHGRRATRAVPLRAAVHQLATLWECVMAILTAGRAPTTRSTLSQPVNGHGGHGPSLQELSQLEAAALRLARLLAARPEFDSLLLVLAHGGCKPHQQLPRRRSSLGGASLRGERSNSVVVALPPSRQSVVVVPAAKKSSSSRKKRDKAADADAPLCELARRYLELHHRSLAFAYCAAHGSADPVDPFAKLLLASPKSDAAARELFATLAALSYARVPSVREHMLDALQNSLAPPQPSQPSQPQRSHPSAPERARSKSRYEEVSQNTFRWTQNVSAKCHQALAPFGSEDGWLRLAQLAARVLEAQEGRLLLVAHLIEHLAPQLALGQIEWRAVPGFPTVLEVVKAATRAIFEAQLQQLEPTWQGSDDEERATDRHERGYRESFSVAPDAAGERKRTAAPQFFAQVITMMHDDPGFIHEFLLTIFHATNYMLPHHVELCLQYLGKLVTEFPAYFVNEQQQGNSTVGYAGRPQSPCADTALLRFVFSRLLESEHFGILKHTELFLLKHFAHLSVTLQTHLTALFATHFRRLFLHWNRDVRYCYYHILLYLTYPGNRLVLGAKSDESIMGAEAAQLFEIPGLVRAASSANWDVFDTPVMQALARYNFVTRSRRNGSKKPAKAPATSWVDDTSFAVVERSVKEYKGHVHTYFASARLLSVHERVPTPAFELKSASSQSPSRGSTSKGGNSRSGNSGNCRAPTAMRLA